MTELVAVDIGGTNARFAIAEVAAGKVVSLAAPTILNTADHASFRLAWEAFAAEVGRPLPRAAALALAGPVDGDVVKLTSSPWMIRKASIRSDLGADRYVVVNDFGAIGHAVAQIGPEHLQHLAGPDVDLPAEGVLTVVGPGTGLGVAQVRRLTTGYIVGETEGGHVDFAPLDALEDAMLARLRSRFRRVSAERIVSGPGLGNIYAALAAIGGRSVPEIDDKALWQAAMAGSDSLAAASLDRFCLSLGAVAGDLALAHGAHGVVIAGGIGLRLADHLPRSGFAERFVAKGRFESRMAAIPVKLITHPQPGLLGAATAFAQAFPD